MRINKDFVSSDDDDENDCAAQDEAWHSVYIYIIDQAQDSGGRKDCSTVVLAT